MQTTKADKLWYDYYKSCPWRKTIFSLIKYNTCNMKGACSQDSCPVFHFIQAFIYEESK